MRSAQRRRGGVSVASLFLIIGVLMALFAGTAAAAPPPGSSGSSATASGNRAFPASASAVPGAASSAAPPTSSASTPPLSSSAAATSPARPAGPGAAAVGNGLPANDPHAVNTTLNLHDHLSLVQARYSFDTDGATTPGAATSTTALTWTAHSTHRDQVIWSNMSARIQDYEKVTDYWVTVRLEFWYDDSAIHPEYVYEAPCVIYDGDPNAGGTVVNQNSDSPYECDSIPETGVGNNVGIPESVYSASLDLRSLVWSTVRGVLAPQGALSLGDGSLQTATQQTIVAGRHLTSYTEYPTVAAGETLEWAAYQRNGEAPQAPDVLFAYRLFDHGAPTGFWVSGGASNTRGAEFDHASDCEIYQGSPLAGGQVITSSPFTCTMSSQNVSGRGDWKVTFTIDMAAVVDVVPLQAERDLPVACGTSELTCIYELLGQTSLVKSPTRLDSGSANNTSQPLTYMLKFASGRSTTNSVNIAATAKTSFFDLFTASIRIAYGWSQTDEVTKIYSDTMTIPPGCVGWFTLAPAYLVVTGNYLYQLNGSWYRAKGITWTIPDNKTPGAKTANEAPITGSDADCSAPGVNTHPTAPPGVVGVGAAEPPIGAQPPVGAEPPTESTPPAISSSPPTAPPVTPGPALAATGTDFDPAIAGTGAGALILLGGVLLAAARRRPTH